MSVTSNRRQARRRPIPAGVRRVREAAAITTTCPSTIYRWIRTGLVPAVHHDGMLYIHIEDAKDARRTRKRSTNPLPAPPEGMVTTRQASNETGAGQVSIQEWARDGKVQAQRHGPKKWTWYVDLDDVRRMARESKPGRQQPT